MQHFAYFGQCCELWGPQWLAPENGEGACVWPPSEDAKEFIPEKGGA